MSMLRKSRGSCHLRWVLAVAGLALLVPVGTVVAGNLNYQRSVGGITVDAAGVVRQATVAERQDLMKQMQERAGAVGPAFQQATELRKVSLRNLEAAVRQVLANPLGRLPDDVQYLAGIQRIEYVLVYPEQQDIVLAGPGEGWKINENGDTVGVTTGQPVVRLDDLLVALRTVEAARREGISVSIDPTPEGRQRFQQLFQRQKRFSPQVVAALGEALGPQMITFTGVPTDSRFARILVAADYQMKQLGMNLEKAPVPDLPGFLDLLRAKNRMPATDMPRWWLACNYEPLVRSEDRLVWQLRGQGVKALTEDEAQAADGTTTGTGRQDPIAKEWADRFTKVFPELAKKDLVFAELRNLMDLCVVAALIQKEDLLGLAGCQLPLLTNPKGDLMIDNWTVPKQVSTQCSYLKIGTNYVITASGGVQIESWEVAEKSTVSPAVKEVHARAASSGGKTWWWN